MDLAAFAADRLWSDLAAGIILMAEAVMLGIYFYRKDRCLVSFRLLLSVFWIGGEALGVMKLSRLHREWTIAAWLSFSLFYLLWLLSFDLVTVWRKRKTEAKSIAAQAMSVQEQSGQPQMSSGQDGETGKKARLFGLMFEARSREQMQKYLLYTVVIMTVIPWAAFLFEAVWLGFIPLFSIEPHAYSYFHVSGVHYFTVSSCFAPSLAMIWLLLSKKEERGKREYLILAGCSLASLLIPVLCVSKFFFAFTIVMPLIVLLLLGPQIPTRYLVTGIGLVAAVFAAAVVFMTASRHYEPGYLDSVFEMKNSSIPVMIQYVYMYIANNYANFNELTIALAQGSVSQLWGLKQLFPVFALTGLKFVFPELTVFYQPVTKDILNTLTIIYDAYYDFNLIGVIGFSLILGAVCAVISEATARKTRPVAGLFYAQIALYLMLSFFSAWFSVATTWFWLVLTAILWLYTSFSVTRVEKRDKL